MLRSRAFNPGAPGPIGGTTPGTITGTVITALNAFRMPSGSPSNPSLGLSVEPNTGIWGAPGELNSVVAGSNIVCTTATVHRLKSSLLFGFSSGDPESTNLDVNVSRQGPGIWQFGTGTTANALGTVAAALFKAGAGSGVTAGPFTAITSIQVIGGIVTTLTGT